MSTDSTQLNSVTGGVFNLPSVKSTNDLQNDPHHVKNPSHNPNAYGDIGGSLAGGSDTGAGIASSLA